MRWSRNLKRLFWEQLHQSTRQLLILQWWRCCQDIPLMRSTLDRGTLQIYTSTPHQVSSSHFLSFIAPPCTPLFFPCKFSHFISSSMICCLLFFCVTNFTKTSYVKYDYSTEIDKVHYRNQIESSFYQINDKNKRSMGMMSKKN